MSDLDPNDLAHHAARMMENPAWERLWSDIEHRLASERDRLPLNATEERQSISIALSLVSRMKRRAMSMADAGKVAQINAPKRAQQR